MISVLALTGAATAQTGPLGVCQALDSARERQLVTVRGEILCHQHGVNILEPGVRDCHPDRYFNQPAAMWIDFAPAFDVPVSDGDWKQNLTKVCRANHSALTVTGIFIQAKWWTKLHHYDIGGEDRDTLWDRLLDLYISGTKRHPFETLVVVSVNR